MRAQRHTQKELRAQRRTQNGGDDTSQSGDTLSKSTKQIGAKKV